ncbi:MAG: phosphoribosylanthranilate isomerase [Betaproteobacteria bacterium]
MSRTRVKICGLTRAADVAAAVAAGADALGFNCYPRSPRYVSLERLAALAREVPALVTPVLLFVNAGADEIARAVERAPQALLQFHGDEDAAACGRSGRPYLRALRMQADTDYSAAETQYHDALALLADAPAPGYGGSGLTFDWTRLPRPAARTMPLVLAGGLTPDNVGAAIVAVRPYAVDVASGVEQAPGVKDAGKIAAFIAAVRAADVALAAS